MLVLTPQFFSFNTFFCPQGPFDVGVLVIGREGILEGMLLLARSSIVSHQRAALETIAHSCSKRDKCSGIIQNAVPILRELYQSSDTEVKVRALVVSAETRAS